MSVCRIIYRRVKFEKKIWFNKKQFIETFSRFASQYEFDSIVLKEPHSKNFEDNRIYSILKHNLNKIIPDLSVDKRSGSKVLFVADQVDDSMLYGITYSTLKEIIFSNAQFELAYPLLLNTLENVFEEIYIIGQNEFSKQLFTYYAENFHLPVERVETVDFENGKYLLSKEISKDAMVIFADVFLPRVCVDLFGKELQTIFLINLYRAENLKTTDWRHDLNNSIIPNLLDKGVRVVKVYLPDEERYKSEKALIRKTIARWRFLRKINPALFEKRRRKQMKTEYLYENQKLISNDNSKGYSEMYGHGPYINFDNGFRRTVGNSLEEKNCIYFFGPCFIRGLGVEDRYTIPSMLNSRIRNKYNVYNYGSEFSAINYVMRLPQYKPGDIIFIFPFERFDTGAEKDSRVHRIDLENTFAQIPSLEKHIFDSLLHFDMSVSEYIMNDLVKVVEQIDNAGPSEHNEDENIIFGPVVKRAPGVAFSNDIHFTEWILECKKRYGNTISSGAIVMNCNPFTNGHRYLIEYASKQVERLFIFVVQEDKSYFPFADRFELVKKGTNDLENVIVLPSGRYMISSMTLPGYFTKDQLADTVLDASEDLMLFLQIAEELNITKRFAGEEPIDAFTKQYNLSMQKMLPRYGVEFVEIPRKEKSGEVISASRVRKALEEHSLEDIEALVPKTTYEYLKQYVSCNKGV